MISESHLKNVCKLGKGEKCCSFLVYGNNKFECAKKTPIEFVILQRRISGEMKAKGDNCSGPPDYKPTNCQ